MLYNAILILCYFLATLGLCGAFADPPNAQHLFNVIHSSMRQWGSSLNHNGMSFFLATVPKGTQLYHGTGRNHSFTGLEWLAFEPEHALNFAWKIEERPDIDDTERHEDISIKWWADSAIAQNVRSTGAPHLIINDYLTHSAQKPLAKPPHGRRPMDKLLPGWLHAYAAKRDLRLLYVDGMSAGKSLKGTLDSQDYILRVFNSEKRGPLDEEGRAKDLCKLAAEQWQSKVDGFIRMEHGFEIILCDFANLELLRMTRNKDHRHHAGAYLLSFFRAVAARYNGIGGERVRLHYDNFVSAYSFTDLDPFPDGSELPRLQSISMSNLQRVFDNVTELVLHSAAELDTASVNWQAIADEIVERYAKRLQYLVSDAITNKKDLVADLDLLFRPFIDYDKRNVSDEIEGCALHFMPDPVSGPPKDSLAGRTIYAISHRICQTLRLAMDDETHVAAVGRLQQLIEYLAWTSWKYCDPSCGLDEICFTAIWPFGDIEDHYHPSCQNGTSMIRRHGYWQY